MASAARDLDMGEDRAKAITALPVLTCEVCGCDGPRAALSLGWVCDEHFDPAIHELAVIVLVEQDDGED